MTVTKRQETSLAPFEFHGLEFTYPKRGQPVADCPFCEAEKHFFASPKTQQWDCKKCGQSGNLYSFLTKIYLLHKEATPTDAYATLSKIRRIPAQAFQDAGLATDGSRWYFPIRNGSPSLVGLRVWDQPRTLTQKNPIISTSETQLKLYHAERLGSIVGIIYICEGEWDTDALEWLRLKSKEEATIIGLPGANYTFKPSDLTLLKGQSVELLLDHDKAGREATPKRAAELQGTARTIKTIVWPKKLKEGYDVSDYVSSYVKKPKTGWSVLQSMIQPLGTSSPEKKTAGKPAKIPTFAQVLASYRKCIHLDRTMAEALAICFATVFSIRLGGDPLWIYLVGPPGSGKTLMLKSFRQAEGCVFRDTIPPAGLVSGYKAENGEDVSPLIHIVGKCLVLKDFTEIISMPAQIQDTIYGQLRGLYDGFYFKPFLNGINKEGGRTYPNPEVPSTYFSCIAGVTHVIHKSDRASLGERFLKVELLDPHHDPGPHIRRSMLESDGMHVSDAKLREVVSAFLQREVRAERLPKSPVWADERIAYLAELVGMLRISVDRDRGDLTIRPRSEIGGRLAQQLRKLGRFLAFVYATPLTPQIYRIIERVALDTAHGWHLDLTRILIKHHPKPLTQKALGKLAHMSPSNIRRKLENMIDAKIIQCEQAPTHKVGQPPEAYTLVPKVVELWRKAKIGS